MRAIAVAVVYNVLITAHNVIASKGHASFYIVVLKHI
jgi:hypothetical protein